MGVTLAKLNWGSKVQSGRQAMAGELGKFHQKHLNLTNCLLRESEETGNYRCYKKHRYGRAKEMDESAAQGRYKGEPCLGSRGSLGLWGSSCKLLILFSAWLHRFTH